MSESNTLEEELNFTDKTFNDAQALNKAILVPDAQRMLIGAQPSSSRQVLEIPERVDWLKVNPLTMMEENETIDYKRLVEKRKEVEAELMKETFVWTESNEASFQRFFDSFGFLKSRWILTFTAVRSPQAQLCLDKKVCTKILSTPLLDMNNDTGLLTGIKALSSFIGYFKSMYLKALLSSKPKLESENFWFYDPVFRGLIRYGNLKDKDVFEDLISTSFKDNQLSKQESLERVGDRFGLQDSERTVKERDALFKRIREESAQSSKFSTFEGFLEVFKSGHSKEAQLMYRYFWIKLIVQRCFDIFFAIITWDRVGFRLKAPKTVLKIVLIMLETGFYSPDELPLLGNQILHASERIIMLEEQLVQLNEKDPNAFSQAEWTSICHESHSYRITIAKISIQMLVLYLDSLTEKSFHKLKGFQTQFFRDISKFFNASSFYKQKYYKQHEIVKHTLLPTLTKIFVNFLLRTTAMIQEYKGGPVMRSRVPIQFYIQLFMSFIGDKKSDFFMISLRNFIPESTLFYRNYYKYLANFEVKKNLKKPTSGHPPYPQKFELAADGKEKGKEEDNLTEADNMSVRSDFHANGLTDDNSHMVQRQRPSNNKEFKKIEELDNFVNEQTIELSAIIATMRKEYTADTCNRQLYQNCIHKFQNVITRFGKYLLVKREGQSSQSNAVLFSIPFAKVITHRLTDDMTDQNVVDFQNMHLLHDLQNVLTLKMFLNKLFLVMNVLTRMSNCLSGETEETASVPISKPSGQNRQSSTVDIQRGFALVIAICRNNCQAINALFSVRNRKHLIYLMKFHKDAIIFSFYCIFKTRRALSMLQNNRLVSHFLFSIFDFEMREFAVRFSTTNSEIEAKKAARQNQSLTQSVSQLSSSLNPNSVAETVQKRITLVCSLIFLSKIFKGLTQPTKFKKDNMSVIEKKVDNANIFFDQKRGKLAVEFEMKLSNLLSKILFPILDSYMRNMAEFDVDFDVKLFLNASPQTHGSGTQALGPWSFALRYLVGLLYHSVKNFYDDGFFQPAHEFYRDERITRVVDFSQFRKSRDGRKTLGKLLNMYNCYQKIDHFMFKFDDKLTGSEHEADMEEQVMEEEFSRRKPAFSVILDQQNRQKIYAYLGIQAGGKTVASQIAGDPVLKSERTEALVDILIPIIFDWLQQRKIDRKIENSKDLDAVIDMLTDIKKSYFESHVESTQPENDERQKTFGALYQIFYSTIESEFDVTFTVEEAHELARNVLNDRIATQDSDSLFYIPPTRNIAEFVQLINNMTELACKNSLLLVEKEKTGFYRNVQKALRNTGKAENAAENQNLDNQAQQILSKSQSYGESERQKKLLELVKKINICLKMIIDIYSRKPEQIRNLTVHRILDRKDMIISHRILTREKLSLEDQFEVDSENRMIKIHEDRDSVCYAHKHHSQHGFGILAYRKDPETGALRNKLTDFELWSEGKYLRINYLLQYKDFKAWVCQTGADGLIFNEVIGYESEVNPSSNNFVNGVFFNIERIRTSSPDTVNIYTHYHMHYYLNRHFYVLLMLLGQLMKLKSQDNKLRELILKKITEENGMEFLWGLWRLFKVFQSFMSKNNFYVKNYFTLYRPFYIIIDFFKNLCEDNFIGFKKLFNDRPENELKSHLPEELGRRVDHLQPTNIMSISEQVYRRMVHGIAKSDLDNPRKFQIDMFDKPAHFNLTNDILYMFIEFINGGVFLPEWTLKLPQNTPVWGNILYRIIDDVNDQFYDIKYNVIVYLAAMKESGNQEFIDFVKEYIIFDKVSELISRLVAKLFVYCRKKNSNQKFVTEEQWLFLDPRLAGQTGKRQLVMEVDDFRDEDSLIGILDPSAEAKFGPELLADGARREYLRMGPFEFWLSLYDFYLLYPNDFSSHKIMDTVIQLMIMLLEMGDRLPDFEQKVRRYNQQVPKEIISWTKSETAWDTLKTSVMLKLRAMNENPKSAKNSEINQVIIWQFINLIIGVVEIVIVAEKSEAEEADGADAPVEKIVQHRFQKLPETFFYNHEMRTDFIKNADISNRESKLKTFFSDIPEKRLLLVAKLELFRWSQAVYYLTKPELISLAILVLFIVSLAINVLMLLFFNDASHDFESTTNGNADSAIYAMAIFSLVLSSLCLLLWLGFRIWFRISFVRDQSKGKRYISKFNFILKVVWKLLVDMVMTSEVRYLFVTILSYSLGLAQYYFFYTTPLFLMLYLSPLLSSILTSIFKNLLKLGYLIIIILSVTNIFAILIVQYFNSDFNTTANVYESDPSICKNYRQCLLNVFSMGLRWGNGIGDMLNYNNQLTSDQYFGLFFLEIIFFTIVNMLLLGAFFGIVVDTFKSYKERLNKHDQMDTTVCFVCGMNNTDFHRYGLNFEEHVHIDHNPFSYFGLHLMLSNKPEIDYSGREIYIWDKFNGEERNSVLPNNNCLKFLGRKLQASSKDDD